MRLLALLLSVVGFASLLSLTNLTVYHFMPSNSKGPEGGLIDAALALILGGGASVLALLFAGLHWRGAREAKGSRMLLAWCMLLPVGFIIVLICAHARSS